MRIAITKPLFAWDSLQDSPSLKTIREFLEVVPDGKLLQRHPGPGVAQVQRTGLFGWHPDYIVPVKS